MSVLEQFPWQKNSTPIGQVLTTVLQADVENLKSQGIHIIVAGLRDDNPADWQVLVLGNLDLIVGTNSTSAMLNFRPFQYNVHDILSNVTGKCQSLLCDLQRINTPLDKLDKKDFKMVCVHFCWRTQHCHSCCMIFVVQHQGVSH